MLKSISDLWWRTHGIMLLLRVLGLSDFFSLLTSKIWISFKSKECSFLFCNFFILWMGFHFDDTFDIFHLCFSEWIKKCLDHWGSIPNCQFWNSQWASLTARVIKNYKFIDWESFLPDLFNIYLNMFEVTLPLYVF